MKYLEQPKDEQLFEKYMEIFEAKMQKA